MSPILYIVTADNCGACIKFKGTYLQKTKADLSKIRGLIVKEVNIARIGDPLPNSMPRELNHFVKWYPTFILDDESSGEVCVFNAEEHNGNIVHMNSNRYNMDNGGIVQWVKDSM